MLQLSIPAIEVGDVVDLYSRFHTKGLTENLRPNTYRASIHHHPPPFIPSTVLARILASRLPRYLLVPWRFARTSWAAVW